MKTRCSKCTGEFEAARQPNCPLCGAPRPRPKIREIPKPIDMTQALQTLNADPVPHKRLKRRRRPVKNLGKDIAAAILAAPPQPVAEQPAAAVTAPAPATPTPPPPAAPPPAAQGPAAQATAAQAHARSAQAAPTAAELAEPVPGASPVTLRPATAQKRREAAVAAGTQTATIAAVVQIAAGPPPIEVEYVFGGVIPDAIVPVTTIAVLPPRSPDEPATVEERQPASVSSLLDRARKTFGKGTSRKG